MAQHAAPSPQATQEGASPVDTSLAPDIDSEGSHWTFHDLEGEFHEVDTKDEYTVKHPNQAGQEVIRREDLYVYHTRQAARQYTMLTKARHGRDIAIATHRSRDRDDAVGVPSGSQASGAQWLGAQPAAQAAAAAPHTAPAAAAKQPPPAPPAPPAAAAAAAAPLIGAVQQPPQTAGPAVLTPNPQTLTRCQLAHQAANQQAAGNQAPPGQPSPYRRQPAPQPQHVNTTAFPMVSNRQHRYGDMPRLYPDTTVYISGLDWNLYEDQFIPTVITFRNTRQWGDGSVRAIQVRHEFHGDMDRLQGMMFIRLRDPETTQAFISMFHMSLCADRIIHCVHANPEFDIPARHRWRGLEIGYPRFLEDVYNIPGEESRRSDDDKCEAERRANR